MSPNVAPAWRKSGENWRAVSSRIVYVAVKLQDSRSRKKVSVSVISVYAPTYNSFQEQKDIFYDDLQRAIDLVPEDHLLLVLGDLNVRVGSGSPNRGDHQWTSVRGIHGVEKMNENGAMLLSFCALNCLSIMNTYFEKRDVHKYTWQHPSSKVQHCIDYIVMRQRQRRFCHDVSALRRADCWTDHRLLRGKLFLANACHASKQPIRKRFAVHKLSDDSTCHAFVEGMVKIKSEWSENMPAGKMWAVKDGILESGQTILGTDGRRQPDWFRDDSEILKPLLSLQNALFARWLEFQCHQDRQKYVAKR